MASQLWWYSARAGGLVAWALLSASVLWGLVLSARLHPPRVRPAWTLDLHRYLGGLASIFVALHVGSIILDSYTHFGLGDVLVPFAAAWHPVAVAWGIVGLYLLLAVELTSLARRSLSRRLWRRVHMLAFPLWAMATIHFATAGTDGTTALARAAIIAATGGVCALTAVRVEEHLWHARSREAEVRRGRDRSRSDGLGDRVVVGSSRP